MPPKEVNEKINAMGIEISVTSKGDRDDYISLTDIAKYVSDHPDDAVKNWLRNKNTIEFLGVWEKRFTIQTLNPSNSTGLKIKLGQMHS